MNLPCGALFVMDPASVESQQREAHPRARRHPHQAAGSNNGSGSSSMIDFERMNVLPDTTS